MRDVVDPELGINVVDLGLVYGLDLDADRVATIDMTLTSAACPLTDVIEEQAREALEGVVTDFRINWVWMPPWGPESITDDGREQLRALGFNLTLPGTTPGDPPIWGKPFPQTPRPPGTGGILLVRMGSARMGVRRGVEGLGLGGDPLVELVRLALAGERDVDGEPLPGHRADGPLERADDLMVRGR